MRSLARLEFPPKSLISSGPIETPIPPIRVVAVAPARIRTPLWTENPDKMKLVVDDEEAAGWVTPEKVADVMLDTVVNEVCFFPHRVDIYYG